MFASIIKSLRLKTRRVVLSTNENGLRDLDTVLNRVQASADTERNNRNVSLMVASIGSQLQSAYTNWKDFCSKYEVVVFCNDTLEQSTSYRVVVTERVNGFDREFDFAV